MSASAGRKSERTLSSRRCGRSIRQKTCLACWACLRCEQHRQATVGFATYLTAAAAYCAAVALATCFFGLGLAGLAAAVLATAVLAASVLAASILAASGRLAFTTGFGASGHTVGGGASLAAIRSGSVGVIG